eukprot:GSMAST32.ASY1.ANO1.1349.1 assembled CDS
MGICGGKAAISNENRTMHENLVKYHICDCAAIRKKYSGVDNTDFLGEGVSGKVSIVSRRSDGQKFALKVMKIGSNSATSLKQIRDEITLFASMDHPNVARLYEAFEETGQNMYMIMELCTGGELFDRLLDSENSRFNEAAAANNFIFATKAEDSMASVVGTSYYIAPEVLDHEYTSACDLWSIGVITYMLLSGNPPFPGETDSEIISNVRIGEYTMFSPVWGKVSDDGKDFINKLLVKDPSKRLTARQALNHKWIIKEQADHPQVQLNREICENMIKFKNLNEFKRMAVATVAFSLTPTQFLAMDTNYDGFVTMHELRDAITKTGAITEAEVDKIFQGLDATNDGKLELSEFVTACLDQKTYMDEARLKEAFTKLDVDGSGAISKEDLQQVLGVQYDDEKVQKMLLEVGGDDSEVDYSEFLQMMRQKSTKTMT